MALKPFASYEKQIEELIKKNFRITDTNTAISILKKVNYYRLSAYFLPFKDETGGYQQNLDFNMIFRIYEFDRKLRNLIFSMLEELEVFLRSQLSYFHSEKYGAGGYEYAANFDNTKHNHTEFCHVIEKIKLKYQKDLIIDHHNKKYESHLPLWVITDFFTFGNISIFYADMKISDKKEFARDVFNVSEKELTSWLICLTKLRNKCAHYSRLYFSIFADRPATPKAYYKSTQKDWGRRVFYYILAMKYLCKDFDSWDNTFLVGLSILFEEYKDDISLNHIGFPGDWYDLLNN